MAAPELVAHMHHRLLVLLSGELRLPIQGLAQGARLLKDRLSSSSRRRLRDLDAAFGILRHVTSERNEFYFNTIQAELQQSSSRTSRATTSTTSPDSDDSSATSSSPGSPQEVAPTGALAPPLALESSKASQTTVHLANARIVDDPHDLVMAAVGNTCCLMAASLRHRVRELHALHADALAPAAGFSAQPPTPSSSSPMVFSMDEHDPLNGWSPPCVEAHCDVTATSAASACALAAAAADPCHAGLRTTSPTSSSSRAEALAAAVDARLQHHDIFTPVTIIDTVTILQDFNEFIDELHDLWQVCLTQRTTIPIFVHDTLVEDDIQQFFQDAVDIFVD